MLMFRPPGIALAVSDKDGRRVESEVRTAREAIQLLGLIELQEKRKLIEAWYGERTMVP